MEALVYIACWKYFFRGYIKGGGLKPRDIHGNREYSQRETKLREAVKDAFCKLDQFASESSLPQEGSTIVNQNKPLYIFVAPEWLFSKTRDWRESSVEGIFYSRENREQYQRTLEELSGVRNKADLLLVAGSILWVEEKTSPGALSAIKEASKSYKTKKQGKVLLPKAEEVLQERKKITKGNITKYLGYNEAFVAYNGGIRKSILKSRDVGDFTGLNDVTLVPGLGAGTFSLPVGGEWLKVGVCICADAGRVHDYGKSTNLFILISQTVRARATIKLEKNLAISL